MRKHVPPEGRAFARPDLTAGISLSLTLIVPWRSIESIDRNVRKHTREGVTGRCLDGLDESSHRIQNGHFAAIENFALKQAQDFDSMFLRLDEVSESRQQFVVEPDELIPDFCAGPELLFVRL